LGKNANKNYKMPRSSNSASCLNCKRLKQVIKEQKGMIKEQKRMIKEQKRIIKQLKRKLAKYENAHTPPSYLKGSAKSNSTPHEVGKT
jgi:hypothetical protein